MKKDIDSVALNSNIRCIEIKSSMVIGTMTSWLNSNIRCIEIDTAVFVPFNREVE